MQKSGRPRQLVRDVLSVATLLFLVAVYLALRAPVVQAADQDSKGTDFWLMFNGNLGAPALTLFITGDSNTAGTVSVPGIAFSVPFTVTANAVTSIALPAVQHNNSDVISNLGVHVTAQAEVTVYGLNRVQFTTDAFLGLPTDILDKEYIVLAHENVGIVNGVQFGIVAAFNGTTVTITPSVTTGARTAGVPYNIPLNQGQTYQLRNTVLGADLTGTIITATQPVAVFGSHQCANVPDGSTFACDHLVEEIPPTSTWGKIFGTMPLATRVGGDTFRFLAQTNNTVVSVNGLNVAMLNRGQVHERLIIGPARIEATEPILVAQFSNGSSFDNVTSDPFMMLVPPFEQYLADYTVTTPAIGFSANFVNIVAPNSAVGAIAIDGVPVPAGAYTPIPGTAFSGTQRSVALGSHHIAGPQPFGLFTYGYDSFDSYGYPGGLALGQVALVTTIDLTPPTETANVGTNKCVTATVRDQNAQPLNGVRVDFSVSGANTTSGFVFTDVSGQAQFCYTGNNAGLDTILGAVGTLTDSAQKTWLAVQGMLCDVDGDKDVDLADINAINAARNTVAGPNDPRDANGDGVINVVDSRFCAVRRTPI